MEMEAPSSGSRAKEPIGGLRDRPPAEAKY